MKTFRSALPVFCALCLLLLGACSSAMQAVEHCSGRRVTLFFATDRNDTGSVGSGMRFGSERDSLHYGTTLVSLPSDHRVGQLESPVFEDDIREHVLVEEVNRMAEEVFFDLLGRSIRDNDQQDLLLFVHGYNMSFEKASRIFGQMVADLDYSGCPVYFSWPSAGRVSGYSADKTCVEWSTLNLERFLEQLAVRAGERKIFLSGHSLGSRALTYALTSLLQRRPDLHDRFAAVLLYAPDIDRGVFLRDIAPEIAASGVTTTLYVSADDRALRASGRINGYSRAGYMEGHPLIAEGVETIDAGSVSDGLSGHSYYHESRAVLSDIYYILNERLPADERFSLEPVDTSDGRYWRFRN